MTFSPLTDVILETTKRSSRGSTRVSRVIVHNWAGMHGGIERLVYSTDLASSNYIILSQAYKMPRSGRRLNGSTVPAGTILPAGTIIGSVPEEYRAWTSGSAAADNSSITFEIQNSTPAIPGEISQAAWNSSVRLLADIAKRYQFSQIKFGSTVRGHKEFQNTSCPGPWLWPRLPQLAADAQQARTNPNTNPAPAKPTTGTKSLDTVAREVIDGKWGNGNARKAALVAAGYNYIEVQNRVNALLGAGTVKVPTAAATSKTVTQLANEVIAGKHGNGDARKKSLGSQYAAVQAEVNRILTGGKPVSSGTAKKSNEQLANEVIDGKWGNGADRQKRLTAAGYNPAAVQAIVNRKLG